MHWQRFSDTFLFSDNLCRKRSQKAKKPHHPTRLSSSSAAHAHSSVNDVDAKNNEAPSSVPSDGNNTQGLQTSSTVSDQPSQSPASGGMTLPLVGDSNIFETTMNQSSETIEV